MAKTKHQKIRKKGLPPGSLIYTGKRAGQLTYAKTIHYTESNIEETNHLPLLPLHPAAGIVWIDLRNINDVAEVAKIGEAFNIHPLAQEDVLNTQQRAKLEDYENGFFFVLHKLEMDHESFELSSEQVAIYTGKNFVISFQEDADDTLESVRKRMHESLGRIRKRGSDYLTYAIIDTIVDSYYVLLDEIETALTETEQGIHLHGDTPQGKANIFHLKRDINLVRSRLLPLRDALNRFYHLDSALIEEQNRPFLRDVADHAAQMLDTVDSYRDMVAGLEALYQAEVSNRLNNVMRLLTVISTIFIPLSFIAGVYGMNFDNMPELHFQHGYFIVLGGMLTLMVSMLIYFKRKRWI